MVFNDCNKAAFSIFEHYLITFYHQSLRVILFDDNCNFKI